jgi:hypothetical protein
VQHSVTQLLVSRFVPTHLDQRDQRTDDDCSTDKNAVSYILFDLTVIDVDADCGDLSDASLSTFVPESQCNMACTGDPIHYCGAGNRLTTYTWKGTMNIWHTPEVTGWYEVREYGLTL